ncbi:MAG: helix-turn-helix transcriptional regulator [Lentimicrobium sp.]|nr:helix-turn-helix transcriptional regulator [Lentimicrobium sp.]
MKYVSDIQREVTDRFLLTMYELKARKKIKTKTEFAEKIKYRYPHLLRLEKNENVAISIDALYYICKIFDANPEYLLTGKGQMFYKS